MIKFLQILFIAVLASPAFAQASFDVETYDLGPEIFGSPTHGAYGIRGRIYWREPTRRRQASRRRAMPVRRRRVCRG